MATRQLDICYEYTSTDDSVVYQWWEVYYWDDADTVIEDGTISTVLWPALQMKPWRWITVKGWQVHDAPGSPIIIATGGPTTLQPDLAADPAWFLLDNQAYMTLWRDGRRVGAKWLRGFGNSYYVASDRWLTSVWVTVAGWFADAYSSGPLRARDGGNVDAVTIDPQQRLRAPRHGTRRRERIYIP